MDICLDLILQLYSDFVGKHKEFAEENKTIEVWDFYFHVKIVGGVLRQQ